MSDFLFTSESVSEGHPDKVADQISDAVLDAILKQDKTSRVAAETLVKDNLVVLAGEITTNARVSYDEVARHTIKRTGYTDPAIGFDGSSCTILVAYGQQSPDIARGVDQGNLDQGAGDQGLMFGYACDETPSYMPLPIFLSHRLVERQAELRRNGKLPWLRPDAKSQVTIRYANGRPEALDTVLLGSEEHTSELQSPMYPRRRRHVRAFPTRRSSDLPDVRLCLRRDAELHAAADLPLASLGRAPGGAAPQRQTPLAAARCEVAGHHSLRERPAGVARHRGALDAARAGHRAQEALRGRDRGSNQAGAAEEPDTGQGELHR